MPTVTRRAFARLSLAAPLAALPLAAPFAPVPASAQSVAAGYAPLARIRIGRFTVTALTDGFADMPFAYFTGRPEAEVARTARRMHADHGDGALRLSFNQFLVSDGDSHVLIDTGPAGRFGESGSLPRGLAAAGVAPEEIDAVILTHFHADHISGLVAGGRKAFPNAQVYGDRRDVSYWTDPARRASAPDYLLSSFDAAGEVLRLVPDLQRTDGATRVADGIAIVDLAGHTPGHVGVAIEDGTERLLMTSDMLFHPVVHPRAPDVGFVFEQDPAAAEAMRRRFFQTAADEGTLIAATHMPFPGLGRIVDDGGRYAWLPADWAHG